MAPYTVLLELLSDKYFILLDRLKFQFSVIILTETWLSPDMKWTDIPGYVSYHSVRSKGRGGGVTVLVRTDIDSTAYPQLTKVSENYESCGVILNFDDIRYLIVGVYRAPDVSVANFNEIFFGDVSLPSRKYRSIFIGDFNIDLNKNSPSHFECSFSDNFQSLNFIPRISLPTRVTPTTESLIDHCWTNFVDPASCGVLNVDITDHFPIFMLISKPKYNDLQKIKVTFREHNDDAFDIFRHKLKCLANVFRSRVFQNVSCICENFQTEIFSIYNSCFPVKQKWVSRKRYISPWLTGGLLRSIRHKHHLFKISRTDNSILPAYKRYRNTLIVTIKNAKKQYFKQRFECVRGDIAGTWRNINSILRPNKRIRNKNIEISSPDGSVSSCPVTVAERLNNHFVSVGELLDEEIPTSNRDPCDFVTSNATSFMCSPTTAHEIISIVGSLKIKNSNVDMVPSFILKRVMDILAQPISDIINVSFTEGVFPTCLKTSRVVPLFKKGSATNPSNYRPISTLPFLSKIFEKAMYNRILKFLNHFKIISPNQFGFRKNCSTSDAILTFVSQIYSAINMGEYFVAIYLDFSKAFDTVNHSILLKKLFKLGIRGVCHDWFRSYLEERQQYVSVSDCKSGKRSVKTGVPQGGIISPLLFSIYVNDMCKSSNKLCFTHFADDTNVYVQGGNLQELESTLNEELARIDEWLCCNRLSLNIDKTYYMIFSNGRISDGIDVKIRDIAIEKAEDDVVKILGIMIDDKLNFNVHVKGICLKMSRSCGVVFKLSQFLPGRILKMLYNSIVLPCLVYCIEIWGSTSNVNMRRISRLQDRVVKLLGDGDLVATYKENNILPVNSLYKYFTLIKFYQQYILKRNENLNSNFVALEPIHEYPTRFSESLCLNTPNINRSKIYYSFLYRGVTFWNELPSHLRTITSLPVFKKNIKKYLLDEL